MHVFSRTLTGAWIETMTWGRVSPLLRVAPSRVRGLKPVSGSVMVLVSSRTLTGAWIETPPEIPQSPSGSSHPHGCVDLDVAD